MATAYRPNISNGMLAWARERSHLPQDIAARKIGVSEAVLQRWEEDDLRPTINQLRKIADVYRRPLSIFYLNQPPTDFEPASDYRRQPGGVPASLSPELILEMRQAQERREALLDLFDDQLDQLPQFDIRCTLNDDPIEVGKRIREWLGVIAADQHVTGGQPYQALNYWTRNLEQHDILVMNMTSVSSDEARGFSIYFDRLPIIAANSKEQPKGRIFTLLHELTHLMLHHSGVCDLRRNNYLPPEKQTVEVFCNSVAAETLVPRDHIVQHPSVAFAIENGARDWTDEELTDVARPYGASQEVILRRLLELNATSDAFYRLKRREYAELYAALRRENSGYAPPHLKAISHLGRYYTGAVLERYYADAITMTDALGMLGVKTKTFRKISETMTGG